MMSGRTDQRERRSRLSVDHAPYGFRRGARGEQRGVDGSGARRRIGIELHRSSAQLEDPPHVGVVVDPRQLLSSCLRRSSDFASCHRAVGEIAPDRLEPIRRLGMTRTRIVLGHHGIEEEEDRHRAECSADCTFTAAEADGRGDPAAGTSSRRLRP